MDSIDKVNSLWEPASKSDSRPNNPVEIYLTREQIFRLAGLANDALVGIQIGTDCNDNSYAYAHMVDFDQKERHAEIYTDGSWKDVT